MNAIKNPNTLDLSTPKPKITKINRLALFSVMGLIVILVMIAVSSLQKKPTNIQPINNAGTDTTVTSDDQFWYKNKSNAILEKRPVATTERDDDSATLKISPDDSAMKQLDKVKQEAYLQAINAPLTPSGLESQNVQAPSAISTPTLNHDNDQTQLDPSLRKLPLSDEQVASLSNVFNPNEIDPNKQTKKQQFIENMTKKTDKDYLNENLKNPVSPFEVKAGTIIPATLNSGINSDLPGQIMAMVRRNVYDTVTGRYLLIPQGSKLIIVYDSNVAYGQERVLPAVKRIIYPNGQSMDLEGMPASDISGYAGFKDQVNNHYGKIYGTALATGAIAALFQISQPQQNSILINPTNSQIAAGAMGQQLAQTATMIMSKNLNIQPTLEIRPGYPFNVTITSDMIFPQPYIG
jgi:type IV secretory pathway VirB10-like protein